MKSSLTLSASEKLRRRQLLGLVLISWLTLGLMHQRASGGVNTPAQGEAQAAVASMDPQSSPDEPEVASDENPPPNGSRKGIHPYSFLTAFEFWLCLIVLIFGAVVLIFEYCLVKGVKHDSEDILRICTITLIVIGTLFAITAGFSAEQIAPAMGLFGTVAGYLLGRRSVEKREIPENLRKVTI
jgi:hypothetical protein